METREDRLTLRERIDVLQQLGQHLSGKDEYLDAIITRTSFQNPWFTIEHQRQAIEAIAGTMLRRDKLTKWLSAYAMPDKPEEKEVGLVMAGNIPLVGFHDWLCVFAAGHRAQVKLSEKDQYLFPYLLKLLQRFDPRTARLTRITDRLSDFDAVIATGSNNSARYFEQYFGVYPHIIRKNRNGIAVLTGRESAEELKSLGQDVFQYFGLGCRNVAKLYVPAGYDFEPLLEALHEYRQVVLHNKYKNNFDYNMAVKVLNKESYLNNGCIILSENESLQSRVAELHYEFYRDTDDLSARLRERAQEIQCIVSSTQLPEHDTLPFGRAQQPELWDYADGVDTLRFLLSI